MQVEIWETARAYEWLQVTTSDSEPGMSDWKWLRVIKSNYGWTRQDQ